MKKILLDDKYPLYEIDRMKTELSLDICEIIKKIKKEIDEDKTAVFIATFDHYSHTKNLEESEILDEIHDCQIITFCFGTKIVNPLITGVRPRSISIVEYEEYFKFVFLEAPNPQGNETIMKWILRL